MSRKKDKKKELGPYEKEVNGKIQDLSKSLNELQVGGNPMNKDILAFLQLFMKIRETYTIEVAQKIWGDLRGATIWNSCGFHDLTTMLGLSSTREKELEQLANYMSNMDSAPVKKKARAIVTISGGSSEEWSVEGDVDLFIIDFDNIKGGDPYPEGLTKDELEALQDGAQYECACCGGSFEGCDMQDDKGLHDEPRRVCESCMTNYACKKCGYVQMDNPKCPKCGEKT